MWKRWNRRGGYGNRSKSKPKKRSWSYSSHFEELGRSSWLPDGMHSQAERDSWVDTPSSASQQGGGDAAADDDTNHVLLGTIRGPVVGLQYYNGEVNNKEMVSLVREPRNPYDSNAVKVENIWGQQVGHIKRELAKPLAHIMDSKWARLEGLVPSGKNNVYRMPVEISFWGTPDKHKLVSDKLMYHGYKLQSNLVESMGPGGSSGPPVYRPQSSKSKSVVLTHAEMQNKLDSLFTNLKQEAKNIELEPAKAIKTQLYSHQKQALHWMCVRENNEDLPPFWKEYNGKYLNTVTNFISQTRPPTVHGGILADEMGLGKTLEVIALILTNFHGGKPLAEPGTELVREINEEEEDSDIEDDDDDSSINEDEENKACGAGTFMRKEDPDYLPDVKIATDVPAPVMEVEAVTVVDSVVDLTCEMETCATEKAKPSANNFVDLTYEKEEGVKEEAKASEDRVASSSRRPRRAAKKPVRYNYSDDSEIEELLMEADIIPKKKAKSSKPKKSKEQKEEVETKEKKSKGKKSNKGKKKTKAAAATAIVTPALPTLDMPNDEPAPTTTKKASKAAPARPSVTVVPGVDSTNSNTTGPRPTLIVCPLSVLSNWLDQFEEHVSPYVNLHIYNYYGHDRTKDHQLISEQDVVITTYNTLAAEYKARKENSTLHKVNWLRVVLDEGHTIRNPGALQTKAVLALKTQRKWALTGTPIQNSVKDLWPLMAFIKLEPFATDKQWWQRTIARPIDHGDKSAFDRLSSLMDAIALRRTKTQKVKGKLMVDLPPKKVVLTKVELNGEERQLYDTMAKEGRVTIGKYFRTGTLLTNYGNVLAILLRLRQLCCHPSLVAAAAAAMASKDDEVGGAGCSEELKKKLVATLLAVLSQGADEECCICLDSLLAPVITPCAHVFCERCINDVIRTEGEGSTNCPLCRGPVLREQLVHVPAEAQEANKEQATEGEWHSSTKVDSLMEQLIKVRNKDKTIKSLVVSQFTSLLNLLEKPLRDSGFNFVRLDGNMSLQKRIAAISALTSTKPNSPTIMLLSLKAGGLGINLTAASRIYLMDPAWNPASEDQCFDRCHRLGQTKEVIVTKFIIQDSVEERMLELQAKKRSLMTGAFAKKTSAEERRQGRVNDIKVLMDITASQIQ